MAKINYFRIDSSYKVLHGMLSRRYGKTTAKAVFADASGRLAALYEEYSSVPKGERDHTHRFIFPRIAMLRAMEAAIGEDAMPLMDELIRREGTAAGKLMGKMTALPLMERFFLRMFAVVAKKQFGPSKGFEQVFHSAPKGTVSFDILDCPYCRYCRLCGCPELIHTFCDSDAYCFGGLSKIEFIRTRTLEKDGKCDFTLRITK